MKPGRWLWTVLRHFVHFDGMRAFLHFVCVPLCFVYSSEVRKKPLGCGSERPGTYSRESRRLQRFGGIATRKPNEAEHRARSHPCSGPQRERTRAGGRREREQPEQPSYWSHRSSTRSARCWRKVLETSRPRAAREVACEEAHVEQRAEENTWVSTWTGKQLVENKGSRVATPESLGVSWRAAHGLS